MENVGTIAISGCHGFLGKALIKRANGAHLPVRGLDVQLVNGQSAIANDAFIKGDVTSRTDCERLCAGVETVFHTAAVVRESGPYAMFHRINVEGTKTMLDAALSSGARRFVMISSVMVHGFHFRDGIAEDGLKGGYDNPYCATKIESEDLALSYNKPGVFDVFVIRPGDIYGPGSIPWTLRPAQMIAKRQWLYVESRSHHINHVYIDNLLDAISLVIQKGKSGIPYTVTDNQRTSVREFFSYYQRALSIRWLPEISASLAFRLASVAERLASAFGKESPFNRESVRYVLRNGQYGISRMQQLGFHPKVSLEEGMMRSIEWLKTQGL